MKILVIYRSYTGYTEKYAKWIKELLQADLIEFKSMKKVNLSDYGKVIYGAPVYADKIVGLEEVYSRIFSFENIIFSVFATGSAPYEEKTMERLTQKNFKDKKIPWVYLRGGFNYKGLSFFKRLAMTGFRKMLEKKKNPSQGEKDLIAAFKVPVDYTSKELLVEQIGNL